MWGQTWGHLIWGTSASAAVPALPGGALLLLAGLLLFVGYRVGRRQRAPRWMAAGIGLAVALLPIVVAHATSTFGVPFTFTNGTVADASQVNQNFSAVAAEINNVRNLTSILTDCDFRPNESTLHLSCGTGPGGATIIGGGFPALLLASVRVPMGAIISSADVWVSDYNSSTNIKVCLEGVGDSFGSYDNTIPCASTSGAPGIEMLTITPPNPNFAVQGSNGSFEFLIFATDNSGTNGSWPSDGTINVRSAYVHYQIP
jgi:hypothetical protein